MVSQAAADRALGTEPTPTPEAQLAADARAATFGRIVALMMASPRHANLSLSQANTLLSPAIARGQVALIGAQNTEGGPVSLAAAAWWAMVSAEVDQRLTDSRDAFLKLDPGEWQSGDQPWIIESVGEPRIVSDLVTKLAERNFKGKPAKLRASLADGRFAVGRLEPKPAGAG